MKLEEILDYLNELAPWAYAEEWDNVGLMVGSRQGEIKRILLCLDVTSKVIKEAIDCDVQLIISHHPFLFSKLNKLDFDTIKGQQIQALVTKGISVISAHTNLDVAIGGVNDTLAEAIGLKHLKPLKKYIPLGFKDNLGLGKLGVMEQETEFNEFLNLLKQNLDITNLRLIGTHPDRVQNVAVFCGSFDVELDYLKSLQPDVLITGDLKYHDAMDAREMGLCIIDVGHFSSERVILPKLQKVLAERFESVEIICSKMESDPFIFS